MFVQEIQKNSCFLSQFLVGFIPFAKSWSFRLRIRLWRWLIALLNLKLVWISNTHLEFIMSSTDRYERSWSAASVCGRSGVCWTRSESEVSALGLSFLLKSRQQWFLHMLTGIQFTPGGLRSSLRSLTGWPVDMWFCLGACWLTPPPTCPPSLASGTTVPPDLTVYLLCWLTWQKRQLKSDQRETRRSKRIADSAQHKRSWCFTVLVRIKAFAHFRSSVGESKPN